MDTILVPGLWLDASSWDEVVPALEAAGHTVQALTPPGLGVPAPQSSEIGMADWVASVVAEIDSVDGPVALVGHSGGGNAVWGAAAARPDRVARVVFVDSVPIPPGQSISDEFELVDGVAPFPGWDQFEEPEIFDLDAPTRARIESRMKSVPAGVPTDPVELADERRFTVPVTVLSGGMDEQQFRSALAQWGPFAAEFEAIADSEVVRLGTGHWPQFSAPDALARAIVEAVGR